MIRGPGSNKKRPECQVPLSGALDSSARASPLIPNKFLSNKRPCSEIRGPFNYEAVGF